MAQNNIPEIAFQPGQVSSQVAPVKIGDPTPAMREVQRSTMSQMSQNLQMIKQNGLVSIQNARDNAFPVAELAQFSKTLQETIAPIVQKQKEEKEAEDVINSLFGSTEGVEGGMPEGVSAFQQRDAGAVAQLETQADAVSRTAYEIEQQTGDMTLSNGWRQQFQGMSAGVVSESVLLTQARMSYGGYMNQFLNSNELVLGVPARDLIARGDIRATAAVMAAGRQRFFQDMGLGRASRTGLVRSLVPTIYSIDGQLSSSYTASAIKERREQTQATLSGQGFVSARNGEASPEMTWRTTADNLYRANTGLSRGQANEQALRATLNGYISSGNVDAIHGLLSVQVRPGQKGSELGQGPHAALIYEAIGKAEQAQRGANTAFARENRASMFEQLSQAPDDNARREIIERHAVQLEQRGLYEEAHTLRNQVSSLQLSGYKDANEAEIQEAIDAGGDVTSQFIQEAVATGSISAEAGRRFQSQIAPMEIEKNDTFKDTTNGIIKGTVRDFLSDAGLKKDELGQVRIKGIDKPLMSEGDAVVITEQMERDMRRAAALAVQRSGARSQSEIEEVTTRALAEWVKDNVDSEKGKYYIPPFKTGSKGEDRQAAETATQRMSSPEGLLRQPELLSLRSYTSAQDFRGNFTPGTPISAEARRNFSVTRGDVLLYPGEVKGELEHYQTTGQFSSQLVQTARQLGVSELRLLNSQLKANGMPTIRPQLRGPSSTSTTNYRNQASASGDAIRGANLIMSFGVPSKGAAYLAGNIQQESSWNGRRTWGEVMGDGSDRNGGLVSWMDDAQRNHYRLRNIENYLGKPISQATDAEQIQAMLWEMKQRNPDAYRIFMNPQSTDRQLQRASRAYWGYGHEGNRYGYSRNIFAQLQR